MTKTEIRRRAAQENALCALGFTLAEADELRRISMQLHRWHEGECGSDSACIVRGRMDGAEFVYDDSGAAYQEFAGASGRNRYRRIPDRETGAKRRLARIIGQRNGRRTDDDPQPVGNVLAYIQTDPRGAALYILLRPGDVREGERADAVYNRGICVW